MEKEGTKYVRRTQKDYSMSFKLSVVQEYETSQISKEALKRKYGIQGDSTIRRWIDKYGNFDISNKSDKPMEKSKDQELLELRQKELEQKDMKAEFFDMMIDIAEKEYHIDIRKNSFPEQSSDTER